MDLQRSLGNAIRHRRTELGLSQIQLAERIGPEVRQSDISRLERGQYVPRPGLLVALSAALELPILDLMVEAEWLTTAERDHYASSDAPPAVSEPPPHPPPGPLVIVADAGAYSADALASLLADYAWRTEVVFDGPHLLERLAALRPDAILVDSFLPRLALANLAEALWEERLDTYVVVLGEAPADTPAQFSHLPKPIDLHQLLELLAAAGYA